MGTTALATSPATSTPARRAWRAPDGSDFDAAAAVVAFQAGDGRALESLVHCYSRMMGFVARRYLRSQQDVDDAVQDAWMAFTRAARTIESPPAVGGWLSVTTARAALAIAKRQARCVPTDFSDDVGFPAAQPPETDADGSDARAVRTAVSRLSARDRQLVDMLFEGDLSYMEVGIHTGRPVGSIGPTRQRIIAKLRRDRSIRLLAGVGTS